MLHLHDYTLIAIGHLILILFRVLMRRLALTYKTVNPSRWSILRRGTAGKNIFFSWTG